MKRYFAIKVTEIDNRADRVVVTGVTLPQFTEYRVHMMKTGGAEAVTMKTFGKIGITDLSEAHMLLKGQGAVVSSDLMYLHVEAFFAVTDTRLDRERLLTPAANDEAPVFRGRVDAVDFQAREAGPVVRLYVQCDYTPRREPVDIYLYGKAAEQGYAKLEELGVAFNNDRPQEAVEAAQGAYVAVARTNGFARLLKIER